MNGVNTWRVKRHPPRFALTTGNFYPMGTARYIRHQTILQRIFLLINNPITQLFAQHKNNHISAIHRIDF